MNKRAILATSVLVLLLSSATPVGTAAGATNPGELFPVVVTLTDQADLPNTSGLATAARNRAVVGTLRAHAAGTQGPLIAFLNQHRVEGTVDDIEPYWVFNGVAARVALSVIDELEARDDVRSVVFERVIPLTTAGAGGAPPEGNIDIVNATAMWNLAHTGAGIVVANLDTGVDLGHPDLTVGWRGGSNSWFDPYGEHPAAPFDPDGHGTATMSVMVGGESGGTAIGIAPAATWIAAKVFDDDGNATSSALHASFQWLLDPDDNPATADAPDVVNNSWTFDSPGCFLDYQLDFQALRAAGILPVFAAGNAGPGSSSSRSPANNPEAFAVGATDDSDLIYRMSSRGPSACPGDTSFPDLVAPGVGIRAADRFGLYSTNSGTSLSAPHVAGALALLLSADSNLSAERQETALIAGAVDLGATGRDDVFGHGRLDVLAAHSWLLDNPNQTPQASFTFSTKKGTYTFDGAASSDPDGNIVSYEWDFGDGATAAGQEVGHQFATGASYDVALTVTDNAGGTNTKVETIVVEEGKGKGNGGGGGNGGGKGGGKPPK